MINVMSFGAVGNGTTDDYSAIQNALNDAVNKQEELYFPKPPAHYRCSQALTIPSNWKGIHIRGEDSGSAALPDHGVEIRFNGTDGFQFRLDSSSHEQVTIERIVIRNSGNKGGSAINFIVNGSRSYHYPVGWWFDLLSFDNWAQAVQFTREGSTPLDPSGYIGRIEISRTHTYNCTNSILANNVFLNLFSMRACRFHVGGTIKIDNAGGYFGLYDIHWEKADCRFHLANTCYDTRFSLHNCGGESNGTPVQVIENGQTVTRYKDGLVKFSGNHFRSFHWDFSGDSLLPGGFELPPSANNWVQLSNSGMHDLTVDATGCLIQTPSTIRVAAPAIGSVADRTRWYWVPTSTGYITRRNAVAQPIAGTRQFGGTLISASPTTTWPWIEGGNQFYSSETIPATPDVTSNERSFVVSFASEMTFNSSRLNNPIRFGLNGAVSDLDTLPFYHPTDEYSGSILYRTDTTPLTTVEIGLSAAGRRSVGYGCWHTAIAHYAADLAHPRGHSYPFALSIANGSSGAITPRGSAGDQIRQKITVRAGGAYAEVICTGVAGDSATKNQLLTVNQPYGGITFSTTDGGSLHDYGGLIVTNNSGADVAVYAIVEM